MDSQSPNKSTKHTQGTMTHQAMKGISISARQLSKRFNREWIFKDLSYEFKAGNTYAITGPNGSGKSTLLQILFGHVPPSTGIIQYDDAAGGTIPVEEIYKHVSIAAPYMDLIDEFTLTEQLRFHAKLKAFRDNITIDQLMEIMYLQEAKDKFIGNFSSGMKQRVKLAVALYTQAKAFFLDEPGTNLDKQAFNWYKTQVQGLPADSLVVIASNNPQEYPQDSQCIDIQWYKGNKMI